MDVFAERGTALQAVMNDRSAMQHVRAQTDFVKVLSGIMRQLAVSDDPGGMLCAPCALGALQRGVLSAAGSPGPTGPNAWAGGHVSPGSRAVIIVAAHAAQSWPWPRTAPDPTTRFLTGPAQNIQFVVVRVSRLGDQVAVQNGGSLRGALLGLGTDGDCRIHHES